MSTARTAGTFGLCAEDHTVQILDVETLEESKVPKNWEETSRNWSNWESKM